MTSTALLLEFKELNLELRRVRKDWSLYSTVDRAIGEPVFCERTDFVTQPTLDDEDVGCSMALLERVFCSGTNPWFLALHPRKGSGIYPKFSDPMMLALTSTAYRLRIPVNKAMDLMTKIQFNWFKAPFHPAIIFRLAPFVNHSCKPNVAHILRLSPDRKQAAVFYITLRPIKAGERILGTYLHDESLALDRKSRHEILQFTCTCEVCTASDGPAERTETYSDGKRLAIGLQILMTDYKYWAYKYIRDHTDKIKLLTFAETIRSRKLDRSKKKKKQTKKEASTLPLLVPSV